MSGSLIFPVTGAGKIDSAMPDFNTAMSVTRRLLIFIAVGIMLVNSSLADEDARQARALLDAGEILPLETILERARAVQPGRVLEVEFESKGERHIYEVELLDEHGVVHELELDARSGTVLKSKQED